MAADIAAYPSRFSQVCRRPLSAIVVFHPENVAQEISKMHDL